MVLLLVSFLVHCRIFANKALQTLCSLSTTSTWREFALTSSIDELKDEKWVWTTLLTFKSKEALHLHTLTLTWKGKPLDTLAASLYQKQKYHDNLVPIEQNLVADGVWSKKKQTLIFSVNEKLIAINEYYLVLSFASDQEQIIKNGKFVSVQSRCKPIL